MPNPTAQVEPISLSNLAGGSLEEAFQDALTIGLNEVSRSHEGVYEPSRSKEIEVEIGLRVRVIHNVQTGVTVITGTVNKLSLPKRATRGSVAYLAGGVAQVDRAQQASLFESGEAGSAE